MLKEYFIRNLRSRARSLSGFSTFGNVVEGNGDDDDQAADDLLLRNAEAAHDQAVVDHAHEHGADKGADDASGAAGHCRAAEHDGCDDAHFIVFTVGVLRGLRSAGVEQTRDGGAEAGEHIGADENAVDLDAGVFCGGSVAADGQHLSAEGTQAQQNDADDHKDDRPDEQNGDAEHVAVAEDVVEGLVIDRDGLRVADPHGHALERELHTQRHQEGGDLHVGDESTVNRADQRADQKRHRDAREHIVRLFQHDCAEQAGDRHDAGDGQVDAARGDDKDHGDGHHGDHRGLSCDVQNIRQREEGVAQPDGKQADRAQKDDVYHVLGDVAPSP